MASRSYLILTFSGNLFINQTFPSCYERRQNIIVKVWTLPGTCLNYKKVVVPFENKSALVILKCNLNRMHPKKRHLDESRDLTGAARIHASRSP